MRNIYLLMVLIPFEFTALAQSSRHVVVTCKEMFVLGSQKNDWIMNAQDIANISQSGILVTDKLDYKVRYHNSQGKRIKEFGRKGKSDGEFRSPGELAAYKDRLVVADFASPRIQVFTKDFEYVITFYAPGPVFDMCFDGNGKLWVGALTHQKGQSLFQFDIIGGNLLKTLPLKNSTGDGFYDQFSMVANRNGELVIAYTFLNVIEVWSIEGEYIKEFSAPGVIDQPPSEKISRGFFSKSIKLPKGNIFWNISIDSKNNLYVLGSDYSAHSDRDVYIFGPTGTFLTLLTLPFSASKIMIDSSDNLYTIEKNRTLIKKYKLEWN